MRANTTVIEGWGGNGIEGDSGSQWIEGYGGLKSPTTGG